ncbi:hypothetical protein TL16_g05421 [Triparma laevis f. inornata]|uniref:Uncharacterized protein n=1 Tax=Triparma laevis f. inornata TaxID=1714386 RepID=A0A9W7AEJ2_9STRA|nr:hypothetical protein TL16_g05421 [Triparma laevis f. inornata]
MFLSSSTLKYDAQDVEDFLYISMEEQFCCQLEDGSPSDVGGIIFDMAVKCLEGDFTLSRQMVEFAEKEREVLEAKMNVNVLVEGEDFEEDMEEEDEMDNITTTTTTTSSQNVMNASSSDMQSFANQSLFGAAPVQQHLPPPRQLGEEEVVVEKEKIVDEDGFEQVVRRSKRKNKGVKGNP